MQREALARIHELERAVIRRNDPDVTAAWASLQTSNHFHWMSTKPGAGAIHRPYLSAKDAHRIFMDAVESLEKRI
jgi:hypothetical protein